MIKFTVGSSFVKSLNKLDQNTVKKIKKKLKYFQSLKNPLEISLKLKGYRDLYRFRVGEYRIIFRFLDNEVILFLAKHRKDIYKGIDKFN